MYRHDVTPKELHAELATKTPPILLDVREAEELDISMLSNVVHIPMREIPARFGELDPDSNIVVICRIGERSGRVASFLLAKGFKSVRNLATGMNGWAQTVDPSLQQY